MLERSDWIAFIVLIIDEDKVAELGLFNQIGLNIGLAHFSQNYQGCRFNLYTFCSTHALNNGPPQKPGMSKNQNLFYMVRHIRLIICEYDCRGIIEIKLF